MTPKPISEIQRVVDTVDKFRGVHAGNENTYLFRLKDALDSISSALCVMNMKIEGKTIELQPQPVATLCEAVEPLLKRCSDMAKNDDVCGCEQDHICGLPEFCREIDNVRHALTAERKRQSELEPLLRHVVLWYKRKVNQEAGADEILIHNIANYLRHTEALDAFDKGAENG